MLASSYVRRMPWFVVIWTCALAAMGMAAIARGDQLESAGRLWSRHLEWNLLAAAALFAATVPHYRLLRLVAYPCFFGCLLLLAAVFLTPPRNGAQRWIPLGPLAFQPSELTKLAFIVALAAYLVHQQSYRKLQGLLVPFVIALVPVGLILREPDLGTSLVFLPVLFAMLFAAGARVRHLALIVVLAIPVLPLMWTGMSAEQKSRIVTLFVQRDGGPAPTGDGYHLHQSKQVIALGGVRGSQFNGTTIDDPQAYHLPASRTDFVYCLVGERFGLIGACATLVLYLALFAAGLRIAAGTREPFGRLLAVGVVTLIATQTIINTGMTVGLMPVTGITLPLISHGGSSLITTAVAIGLLLNVGLRPGYEVAGEPFSFAAEA
ncbi:MAG TPA: FtsW/RodA/SpoVE family cell cycle protein [Planctomycetaceae bacterium]|nr:FtsW/RodA/SpoVE family cell cycle protein [Planctomycetaceae bacterium]